MTTTILEAPFKKQSPGIILPVTPRGRALYTVDWFLNGKPVLSNHDNPCMTLRNGVTCC